MSDSAADATHIERVRGWISEAEAVVALVGAGISTDSGIPDFRGPQGVWTKNPGAERKADISYYLSDPEVRKQAWQTRLASPAWAAQPNAGHRALVDLEQTGKLAAVITQNIDGLHHAAGSDPDRVIEVHGTLRRYVCMTCGSGGPMEDTLERVRAGEEDPECLVEQPGGGICGGILKSATVSFGQSLAPDDLERSFAAAASCDLLLAVGSSLSVYPIAGVVPVALRTGARLVIVNAEPTPFDQEADAVLRGSISEVLPALVPTP